MTNMGARQVLGHICLMKMNGLKQQGWILEWAIQLHLEAYDLELELLGLEKFQWVQQHCHRPFWSQFQMKAISHGQGVDLGWTGHFLSDQMSLQFDP